MDMPTDNNADATFLERSWKALAASLAALLAAGLLLGQPALGQTTASYVRWADEIADETEATMGEAPAPAAPNASATSSERHRHAPIAVRVPSVEEVPALGHTVAVKLSGASLERALGRIAAKAGLNIAYLRETVAAGKTVTLKAEAISVRAALRAVLRGTDLRLVRASGDQLVLMPRPAPQKAKVHSPAALTSPERVRAAGPARLKPPVSVQGTIAGTVTDASTGEELPGVNVLIEGSIQGSATDANGQYTITGVEPGTYTVRASFVGYGDETREGVQVEEGQTTTVDFAMQQQATGLDEVVVVGYGTQQRRDLTGAVSSVSAEEIQSAPVTTVTEALQGRASGVQVRGGNLGEPGAEATIRIRGVNSLNASNEPLFVVDGFPITGGLSTINPGDIESVEILKDASATAIYGTRGSNGVVLITTKSGDAERSDVSFQSSFGRQQARKLLDLLSAEEWARYTNEAARNSGVEPPFSNPEQFGEGTNWQEVVFRPALQQNYQLSFSGGSEDTRYAVTGSYLDREGIMRGSGFWRGTFRANLTRDVTDRLQILTKLTASRASKDDPALGSKFSSPAVVAHYANPVLPVRDEQGRYTTGADALEQVPELQGVVTGDLLENPLALGLEPTTLQKTDRFRGNFAAEYALMEALIVKTELGMEYIDGGFELYVPTTLNAGESTGGTASVNSLERVSWLNENTINYNDTFAGRHNLDVLAGFTLQEDRSEGLSAEAEGFVSDFFRANNLGAASNPQPPTNNSGSNSLISYLGRVNYTLDDKYLFTLTGRVDGSSRFGAGNKYGFFPSGAVAWRLSEEGFIENLGVFSDLKIRTSYGVVGNQAIGRYQSLARFGNTGYPIEGGNEVGIGPASIANPDLKWERTEELNIGLDAGFWGNRLTLTANYYTKTTSDLLATVNVPSNTGFTTSLQNVGSVKNEGLEVAVGGNAVIGDLNWSIDANVTTNKNEVVELASDDDIIVGGTGGVFASLIGTTNILREGEPIGTFYTYRSLGLWESQEQIDEVGTMPNALPGIDERYEDVNGDGLISPEDRAIVGHGRPDFTFGLSNTLEFRQFDLSVFLQGAYGHEIFNPRANNPGAVNTRNFQDLVLEEDYPRPTISGAIPRASYKASSSLIEDGSYLRVKNVRLGYRLPSTLIGGDRALRVYVSAQNLFTLTGYENGYDPEANFFGGQDDRFGFNDNRYPAVKTFTAGITLDL